MNLNNINNAIDNEFNKLNDEYHYGKQKYLSEYENVNNILDYMGDCYTFFKNYNLLELSYQNIMNDIWNDIQENNFHIILINVLLLMK